MIKHIVLLNWKEGTTDEQIREVTEGFRQLSDQVPGIESYQFGPDAGIYKGNCDYSLVAEFKSEADLRAYAEHPLHLAFLKDITGPVLESFYSSQFEF